MRYVEILRSGSIIINSIEAMVLATLILTTVNPHVPHHLHTVSLAPTLHTSPVPVEPTVFIRTWFAIIILSVKMLQMKTLICVLILNINLLKQPCPAQANCTKVGGDIFN